MGMHTPTKSRAMGIKSNRHYECNNNNNNNTSNKKDKAFKDSNDLDLFSASAHFDNGSDGDDDDLELMVGGWRDFHV